MKNILFTDFTSRESQVTVWTQFRESKKKDQIIYINMLYIHIKMFNIKMCIKCITHVVTPAQQAVKKKKKNTRH